MKLLLLGLLVVLFGVLIVLWVLEPTMLPGAIAGLSILAGLTFLVVGLIRTGQWLSERLAK
jgi:hypothetical protein